MAIRAFSTSVVGAPYLNKDGSDRRFEILLCAPGDPLTLVPEPRNPHDEHAVAVFTERGISIGYVNADRAVYVAGLIRGGHVLQAIFQQATPWGAYARIGVDEAPTLPNFDQPVTQNDWEGEDDSGFYPDFIPPDD